MNGVIKMKDGVREQVAEGLTFGEAFMLVYKLRSKRDGNYYWIGSL